MGHLKVLQASKALGDELVVGVSTDELIKDYKGVEPVIPFEERFAIVEAIGCVDKVVRQTVLTEVSQLQQYAVDLVTIGDDWENKYLEGLEWMKQHGEVVYLPYTKGVSTTGIKRQIIENSYALIAAELKREHVHVEDWKARQRPQGT